MKTKGLLQDFGELDCSSLCLYGCQKQFFSYFLKQPINNFTKPNSNCQNTRFDKFFTSGFKIIKSINSNRTKMMELKGKIKNPKNPVYQTKFNFRKERFIIRDFRNPFLNGNGISGSLPCANFKTGFQALDFNTNIIN